MKPEVFKVHQDREAFAADNGVEILKTCTPYLAGNVPAKGEHCAWMESSAVVYCNSVLGARTNTEGRESTSAAMITGKIPDLGLHQDAKRLGTHRIDVEVTVESVMDWGMLGYFVGDVVQEHIPVVVGSTGSPTWFATSTSAPRPRPPAVSSCTTSSASRLRPTHSRWRSEEAIRSSRSATERPNNGGSTTSSTANAQRSGRRLRDARLPTLLRSSRFVRPAGCSRGRKSASNCRLVDLHVSRGQVGSRRVGPHENHCRCRRPADDRHLLGVCAGLPPGTKVAALDSAKQTHYLPAIMGFRRGSGRQRIVSTRRSRGDGTGNTDEAGDR